MRKKRILLVDDEHNLLVLLKLNLEKTNRYEVKLEHRAMEVLAAAEAFKPDLIMMDFMMPEMNGTEVAAKLQANQELKHIPVIFLTASVAKGNQEQRKEHFGGRPMLSKPASPEEVIACIEQHLIDFKDTE